MQRNALSGVACLSVILGAVASGVAAPPVQLTSEQDHRRMLGLLGIESLRPGANGMDPKAPNAANADESRARHDYKLPDPLVANDGTRVTTPEQWWTKRRPEIVELFDREVYGRVPKETPKVTWEVVQTTPGKTGGIDTVTKQLVGRVDNSSYPEISVNIEATLTTPANAAGPVPVMVEFGFNFGRGPGTRRATTGPGGGPGGGATRPAIRANRPTQPAGPTWQEQVIAKGWGYAILTPASVQADNGAGLTQGIVGLCNKGQPRGVEDWGALRAWAWGASRLLDYLETDPAVDAKQVGIEGLSRYGKAAIVAMAYEPRFAIGFIGSSGQGGVKIIRRNFGEMLENVASSGEYHWMCGNYLKYAGPLTPDDLPVDAHMLVALCAPRPVFISVGSLKVEGTWIDAVGNFLGGAHASPVYELLGKRGMGTLTMPPEETGLTDGDIAFRQHAGGHTTGPNWPTFLEFADRYLDGPPPLAKSAAP